VLCAPLEVDRQLRTQVREQTAQYLSARLFAVPHGSRERTYQSRCGRDLLRRARAAEEVRDVRERPSPFATSAANSSSVR
jgi:hypothetical protein